MSLIELHGMLVCLGHLKQVDTVLEGRFILPLCDPEQAETFWSTISDDGRLQRYSATNRWSTSVVECFGYLLSQRLCIRENQKYTT